LATLRGIPLKSFQNMEDIPENARRPAIAMASEFNLKLLKLLK